MPLKYKEYGVLGGLILMYSKPHSIYLRGTISFWAQIFRVWRLGLWGFGFRVWVGSLLTNERAVMLADLVSVQAQMRQRALSQHCRKRSCASGGAAD